MHSPDAPDHNVVDPTRDRLVSDAVLLVLLEVPVEPSENAFLHVDPMRVFLDGVSLARVDDQLCIDPDILECGVELVSLADRNASVELTVQQQCWSLAV